MDRDLFPFYAGLLPFPHMKTLLLSCIWIYQKTLSPDHGWFSVFFPYGYCKFVPTCSQYMYQAVQKYGLVSGIRRGMGRICRCHPWSSGGIDEP